MGKYRGLFFGLTTVDIQYFVDKYPSPNEKVKIAAPDVFVGGPATNAAVAFSLLNGGSCLASPVGANPFKAFIADDFSATGVSFWDIVKSQAFSPIIATVITSQNGDRSILSHNPPVISPSIFPKKLIEEVKPDILLVDGFYPEFCVECAKLCRDMSVPTVADCGSWKPQYYELLKYVDIAICSSDFYPPGCESPDNVFDFIREKGVTQMAISRGARSIVYENNKKKGKVVIESIEVVDTLGAGDFLHGAFCYYLLEYKNFETALKRASVLASLSCTSKGTREWLGIEEDIYIK